MAIDPIWKAQINQSGQIQVEEIDQYAEYCRSLAGQDVEIIVRKFKQRKDGSDQQRGYYWAVIVQMISDYSGDDEDSVHEFLTLKFAPRTINKKGKRVIIRYSKQSTVQREVYQEKCRQWGAVFLGLNIPLPNQAEARNE